MLTVRWPRSCGLVPLRRALTGALLLALPAPAQTIRGVVLEDGARSRVVAATVELLDADLRVRATTLTDSLGTFVVRAGQPGRFAIRLNHLSYVPVSSSTFQIDRGEVILIELRMGRSAVPLEPLVVTAVGNARLGGFYERMQKGALGSFITRDEIEKRSGAARTTELLQGVPGIRLIPLTRGRGASVTYLIATRGAGARCGPALFVNGAPLRQYTESGIDDFLSPSAVEAIEVYPSAAATPAPFQLPNTCGAVAFWLRTGQEEGSSRMTWKRLGIGLGVAGALVLLFTSLN